MYNNHHASFGKQLVRALWGMLLSFGFGGFWIGLCISSVWLSIVSGAVLFIGMVGSIRTFMRCNSYSKHRNNHRAYRRY